MNRKEQITQLLEDSPNDNFLRFALAKEYEKSGETDAALELYQRLVADSPDYPGTYYHLGKLLEQVSKPIEADAVYARGIAKTKQLGELHAMRELMGARTELGVYDEDDA